MSKNNPSKNKLVTCDFCKKEYYVTTQVYNLIVGGKRNSNACSRECQHELEKIRRAKERELWPILVCSYCGKEYQVSPHIYRLKTTESDVQFCGKKCFQKYLGKKLQEDAQKRHEEEWEHKFCEICGKEYLVDPSQQTVSKYCSRDCQGLAKTKNATIYVKCQQCGKEFPVLKGQLNFFGVIKYCSKECRFEAKKKRQIKICTVCGKEYEVHDCYAEKSVVCSRECMRTWLKNYSLLPEVQERLKQQGTTSHTRNKTAYTTPELIVQNYFIINDVDFIPQYVIGNVLTADFFLPQYNCVLEVYGDYWHSNPRKYGDGENLIPLSEMQKKNRQKDIRRYKVITGKYKYKFYSIWEYGIKNDLESEMQAFFNYIDSKIRRDSVLQQ